MNSLYTEYIDLEARERLIEAEQLRLTLEFATIQDRKREIIETVGVIAVESLSSNEVAGERPVLRKLAQER